MSKFQLTFDDLEPIEDEPKSEPKKKSLKDKFGGGSKVAGGAAKTKPKKKSGKRGLSRPVKPVKVDVGSSSAKPQRVSDDDVPTCRRSCFNCEHGSRSNKIGPRSAVCGYGSGFVIPDADRKGGDCGVWTLSSNDTYTYYEKA